MQMLALLNVAMIQVVLGIVMFTSKTHITTTVHVMPLAMTEMIAVQMHKSFAYVSAIAKFYLKTECI